MPMHTICSHRAKRYPYAIYTHIGDMVAVQHSLFLHTTVVYIYFFNLISNPLTVSVPDKDY